MGTNPRSDLTQPATIDLQDVLSIEQLAAREGWDADLYALGLAEQLRTCGQPANLQLERLRALAGPGAAAGRASSDELARHAVILDALFHRCVLLAARCPDPAESPRRAESFERLSRAAIRAQRAAGACHGALLALRQQRPTPTTPSAEELAGPEPLPTSPAGRAAGALDAAAAVVGEA